MKRIGLMVLLVIALAAFGAQAPAATVQDVVDQVSVNSYRDFLDNHLFTHTGNSRGFDTVGTTRYPAGQHNLARNVISNEFSSFGLSASIESFSYGQYVGAGNVIGVKTGTVHPEQVYIVGSHYDSVENPGADDNASGTAGVLEAARVLSQYQFESTIVFAAFDLEEKGLYGSTRYIQDHPGQQIMGMISLDMIAYNPAGSDHNKAYVYGRTTSDPTKQSLADALTLFGGGVTPEVGGDEPASDHAPFEAAGYQAALLIEHAVWSNPNYHTAADTIDTANYIDYQFAADMTRGSVGWLAESAVLVPEPATMLLLAAGAAGLFIRRRRGCSSRATGCSSTRD